jgi:hypothetical protein
MPASGATMTASAEYPYLVNKIALLQFSVFNSRFSIQDCKYTLLGR